MSRIQVSMALARYHHCVDLVSGDVGVEGAELVVLQPPIETTLQGFARHRYVDVSEYSLAQYVALRSRGDRSLIAIPVFPSRVFRHSSIYVTGPDLLEPRDLDGRRIGVPEWAQTAGVWIRGILADEHGLDLTSVQWVQGGINDPGRIEISGARPPESWHLTRRPDVALDDLLRRGELEAVMSARAPGSYGATGSATRRLFADHRTAELAYWRRSRIMPTMHVVVLRSDVHEKFPWLATSLLTAFAESKRRAENRLTDQTLSHIALPWVAESIADLRELFPGGSWWPYGLEPNRHTLETFLRYAHHQGITDRAMTADELFAPSTRDAGVRV
jgi:4,5-dihydroxyphthalate decarboxylase